MPTYRMLIEYDGTEFQGWQTQPSGPTVQEALERALEVLLHTRCAVVGSGRTDAGVHARGQVAHFVAPDALDVFRLRRSLNGLLPRSVAVLALEAAPDGFHARYGATRRRYRYYVATEPRPLERRTRVLVLPAPDFEAMNRAAAHLLGRHDFSTFCRARAESKGRDCTVFHAAWTAEARPGDWRFDIEADRFLHGMVRTVVGTLLQVGHGRRDAADVAAVLALRDRRAAGPAAPAHGLVLDHVEFAEKTLPPCN